MTRAGGPWRRDADVVHANLTVYENLLYNALLRLPRTHTKATKVKLLVQTMRALGITHISDSLVGDASRRGISGGQKKRVNIGMELVAMPAVIFMDEPCAASKRARSPSAEVSRSTTADAHTLWPVDAGHRASMALPRCSWRSAYHD
jgi:ABC-type sugar transport system ATPase subunit